MFGSGWWWYTKWVQVSSSASFVAIFHSVRESVVCFSVSSESAPGDTFTLQDGVFYNGCAYPSPATYYGMWGGPLHVQWSRSMYVPVLSTVSSTILGPVPSVLSTD